MGIINAGMLKDQTRLNFFAYPQKLITCLSQAVMAIPNKPSKSNSEAKQSRKLGPATCK